MIITVTFNPAIDKTAEVKTMVAGGLNRLSNVMQDAGGKGVNVSKTIHAFGGNSLCTGFLAGSAGEYIDAALKKLNIASDFVWVNGMTRTNLKVLDEDMELTELNEAGPEIGLDEVNQLVEKICELCKKDTIVVLSGNVSKGVDTNIYHTMIERIKAEGGRVVFDADGELFAKGVSARPLVIKPNKYELATYFEVDQNVSNEEIIKLAKTLLNEDTQYVVVSMGKEGSIFITKDAVIQAEALKVEAHSSVGAGDAMVAGISYAIEQNYSLEEMIRFAVAASAGAVMTKGTQPAEKEVVEELKQKVVLKTLEEN